MHFGSISIRISASGYKSKLIVMIQIVALCMDRVQWEFCFLFAAHSPAWFDCPFSKHKMHTNKNHEQSSNDQFSFFSSFFLKKKIWNGKKQFISTSARNKKLKNDAVKYGFGANEERKN